MEYTIVQGQGEGHRGADRVSHLEKLIQELLKDGWRLHGTMFVVQDVPYQAMTKEDFPLGTPAEHGIFG